ncbi:MAG: hypothetical protein NTV80_11105 [Verrucomicrobia bacterium]|nr:hypothetical protein [Verrucomicrobiota bacterium]
MSSLLKSARERKLSPLRRDFDIKVWEAAKPADNSPVEDLVLWGAGLVFNLKLNAFWSKYKRLNPKGWNPRTFRRCAIGLANRNLREASVKAEAKVLQASKAYGFIPPEHLTMKIDGALSGLEYALDDLLAVSVDGLLKPLKDSYDGESISTKDVTLKDVIVSSLLGQLHSNIHHLWEDCVWNGWLAIPRGDIFVFSCPDKKIGELVAVGFTRQMSIFSEMSSRCRSNWAQEPELALWQQLQASPQLTYRGSGKRTKIIVGPRDTSLHGMPKSYPVRLWAHEPYMVKALNEAMPTFPTLTPMLLLSAWELLASLAEEQIQDMPLAQDLSEVRQLKQYAPLIPKSELIKAFSIALGTDRSVSADILGFFTFNSAASIDFWQQPLVEIDPDTVCPVLAAIHTPNTLFMVEGWMWRSGVRLDKRGIDFERYEREVLGNAIANSCLKDHAQVLPYAYKLTPEGDIDLMVRLGDTILALELKCNLYPTRPSQFHNHFKDLTKGAAQIMRKAKALKSNLDVFSRQTGWIFTDPSNIRIIPIVMTNLTLGAGMVIEDAVVTDRWIFERFFSEGSLTQFAKYDTRTGVHGGQEVPFYNTPVQAEQNIEAYLRNPPQLEHYKAALNSSFYPMPSMDEGDSEWLIHHFEVDFSKLGLEGFNLQKIPQRDEK